MALTRKALRKIKSLLRHGGDWERIRALERLEFVSCGKELRAELCLYLRTALTDENELVRCNALEALGNHPYCIDTEEIVAILSGDQSSLVRGEAADLLGIRGDRSAESSILQAIAIADDEAEQASMYFALCLFQNPLGLDGLLRLLKSTHYLPRCAAANLLPRCTSAANREVVLSALTNALAEECTVAARSSISNALAEIKRGQ
ncbi:MAG: HEAT repeat domain-containing protein [Azoarcus sp.]|jgi:HEAT repeat protein|nr:HEAT repeat domain-containing protein [Azoarcus sp.]